MRRTQNLPFVMVCTVFVVLAVTAVTATSRMLNTPLYTYRMERASSEMNFLSTPMNGFTYTTEKGYYLNCNGHEECCEAGSLLLVSWDITWCDKTCFGSTQDCGCPPSLTCNHTFCTCMPPPCPLKAS